MAYDIKSMTHLQQTLKSFRKLRGLSQNDVAQKLGVSQQTYQALEARPQNATIERLFKVFVVLGIRMQLVDHNIVSGFAGLSMSNLTAEQARKLIKATKGLELNDELKGVAESLSKGLKIEKDNW